MNKAFFNVCAIVLWLGFLPPPALADDAAAPVKREAPAEEIEYAQTPTKLLDLLPEGGIEAVDIDYWVLHETHHKGEVTDRYYEHVKITAEREHLIFLFERRKPAPHLLHGSVRVVYGRDGKLRTFRQLFMSGGSVTSSAVGRVEDGELVLKVMKSVITLSPDVQKQGGATVYATVIKKVNEEHRIPIEKLESSIQEHLLPLVHAYHRRQGSLAYGFDMMDPTTPDETLTYLVQKQGQEQVDWAGQQHRASRLVQVVRSGEGREAIPDEKKSVVVLDNGTVFSTRSQPYPELAFVSRRVMRDEAAAELGLEDDE